MTNDRTHAPTSYHLHVVGLDTADVVVNAAGLIIDRAMSGWRVTVALQTAGDTAAVRILGADVVEFDTETTESDDECVVVAVSAELDPPSEVGDVLVWGNGPGSPVEHRLSAAGLAFKAQALATAGLALARVDGVEKFSAAATQYRARDAR